MATINVPSISSLKNITKLSKNKTIIAVIFVVLVLIAGYFFIQYQNTQSLLKNPKQASDVEAKALVVQVGKLIELPTTENPTIATVSDSTKLADQPFFAKAINGDKVLLYSQAKMIILFRPSLNKIITIGTVNVGASVTNNNQPVAPTLAPISAPTVAPTATIAPVKLVVPSPTVTPAQ